MIAGGHRFGHRNSLARRAVSSLAALREDGEDGDPGTVRRCPTTTPATPFDALQVMASQQVALAPGLRHIEIYTMRGLLTLLWHDPPEDRPAHGAALVLCGGAMGGLLGPAEGMYHRLGVEWAERGVAVVRVSYRRPNDLEDCTIDMAAAVQLVNGAGAERVVVMGHSFGGAVAVRVGVGLAPLIGGVVTFATQSAGCEAAAGLQGKPLLLFHGERDEILPVEASEMVRMLAGAGEVVRLPGRRPPAREERRRDVGAARGVAAAGPRDHGRCLTSTAIEVVPSAPCGSTPTTSSPAARTSSSTASPTDGTVLTVTHWPGYPPPEEVAADTSAEMAFRLETPPPAPTTARTTTSTRTAGSIQTSSPRTRPAAPSGTSTAPASPSAPPAATRPAADDLERVRDGQRRRRVEPTTLSVSAPPRPRRTTCSWS